MQVTKIDKSKRVVHLEVPMVPDGTLTSSGRPALCLDGGTVAIDNKVWRYQVNVYEGGKVARPTSA